jgi:hypothetical protein
MYHCYQILKYLFFVIPLSIPALILCKNSSNVDKNHLAELTSNTNVHVTYSVRKGISDKTTKGIHGYYPN